VIQESHKPVHLAPPTLKMERRPDGSLLLSTEEPLEPIPPHLGHWLRHWAEAAAEQPFLAERDDDAGGWCRLGYGEARRRVDRLSAALLARGLGPERPLVILSGNSIAHALLMLAAIQTGVPVAPLSVAYSEAEDLEKLGYLVDLLRPGMIFAEDGPGFSAPLRAIDTGRAELVHGARPFEGLAGTAYEALLAEATDDRVEAAFAAAGPDDVAKILFTSGSTGMPKGVVTPNAMLTANQVAWRQVHPFLAERPPVVVDWLPWNHCFGGSFNVNVVLANGGTFYVDPGKPMPGQFEATLDCFREIAPTIYLNVPAGIDLLLPHLEADAAFREYFFQDLELIFYAGSILPAPLWERLEAVSAKACGKPVIITTAYGMTETGPMHTMACEPMPAPSHVGLPIPGSETLLIPRDDRYELRCRGVNVTPGYFRRDDLNEAAFDAEGFLVTGDATRFVDPDQPARGLVFEGRLANNFKLLTGTWVQTDAVRVAAVAAAPLVIRDALICGHDRDEIGLLIFPNIAGCRELSGADGDDVAELVREGAVRDYLNETLDRHNARFSYRSRRIGRVRVLDEPPSVYEAELTDKTYVNQRAGLERRQALAEELYSKAPGHEVIILD
jgi:feruloyl-CoA synthase